MNILGLDNNPMAKIKRLPHDRAPQYTPPTEHILKVLAAANREERIFLNCYLQTGARRSEIFRWTWAEGINFEKREVRLGTRKRRDGSMEYEWLPMSDELHDELWSWWKTRPIKDSPYSSCLNFCPNGTCFLVLVFSVDDPGQCFAETINQLVAVFCDKV